MLAACTTTAIHLLAAIKPTFTTGFGGFDRLAVDDDSGWLRLAPLQHAHGAPQAVVDFEHRAIVVPFIEVIADGARWREVEWDQAPLTASAILIHQGVNHTSQTDSAATARAFLGRKNRFNKRPLRVGQIGQVAHHTTLVLAFQCTNQSWYHDGSDFPNAL